MLTRPWMTVRHCRMRLTGIEDVLTQLIAEVQKLRDDIDKVVKE